MSVQEWLDLLDDAELMLRPADYKVAVLAFVYVLILHWYRQWYGSYCRALEFYQVCAAV